MLSKTVNSDIGRNENFVPAILSHCLKDVLPLESFLAKEGPIFVKKLLNIEAMDLLSL